MTQLIEDNHPPIQSAGFNTNKAAAFGSTVSVAGAFSANGNLTVATGKVLAVTDSAGLTAGGIVVPQYEYVTSNLLAAATFANGSSYPLYTFPNDGTTWKCVFASLRFTVAASAAATCQVFLDASGTAPGGGTAQFDTMLLNGSANTVVNAANPVGTASAAGASISIKAATQATTGLVNMVVTVAIQRLT